MPHGLQRPYSSRSSKDIFSGLHYPLTWSNGFCGQRGKRGALVEKGKGPMAEKWCYDIFIFFNFLGKRGWRQENGPTWFFSKTKKNQHIHFLGAWSFLLVHIRCTPSEGPINFVNWFLKTSDHGSWTVKLDHEKGHLLWSNFMVHGVHEPLALVTSGLCPGRTVG
jgi:hypothetical protein